MTTPAPNTVTMTDEQQVTLSCSAVDAKGQPVADTITYSVDNADVVAITDNGDGTCVCVAGVEGSATVTATDGTLSGQMVFTITGGAAASLVLSASAPEAQPAAQ